MNEAATGKREGNLLDLQAFISDAEYKPGDRLPAERELVARLGMKRSTLRRALDILERDGTIWRHVGKGTFLSEVGAKNRADTFVEIGKQLTPVKMMRARLCLEPAIAREAAINASTQALGRILLAREATSSAENWAIYEAKDDEFHRAIAVAADNILLLDLFDRLNQIKRDLTWGSVTRDTARPPETHKSVFEHAMIFEAIQARDPARAHDEMRKHIGSVSARLFGEI